MSLSKCSWLVHFTDRSERFFSLLTSKSLDKPWCDAEAFTLTYLDIQLKWSLDYYALNTDSDPEHTDADNGNSNRDENPEPHDSDGEHYAEIEIALAHALQNNKNQVTNDSSPGASCGFPEDVDAGPIGNFIRILRTKPDILIRHLANTIPTLRRTVLRISFADLGEKSSIFDLSTLDGKVSVTPSTKDLDTVIEEERMGDFGRRFDRAMLH